MRGWDHRWDGLFSYVRPESRIPADHPLRLIRRVADEALAALDGKFAALYSENGRPSIPPEQLLRALLLQAFYSIRSERQLMEQLNYNLLSAGLSGCRWMIRSGCRRCSARTATGCGACHPSTDGSDEESRVSSHRKARSRQSTRRRPARQTGTTAGSHRASSWPYPAGGVLEISEIIQKNHCFCEGRTIRSRIVHHHSPSSESRIGIDSALYPFITYSFT